jgi:pullulanase
LRSKSLDRNRYNSGDWFNRLDFTARANNWGVGLPPAPDNQAYWPVMGPLLADPALKPSSEDIRRARQHLVEALEIRRSSALFRLRTAEEVGSQLKFHNTGPGQVPGLIAFSLSDADADGHGPNFAFVVVLLNAAPAAQTLVVPELAGRHLQLHPVQKDSADPVVRTARFVPSSGTFTVPGRTAAVFVAGEDNH